MHTYLEISPLNKVKHASQKKQYAGSSDAVPITFSF